jgi:hypothetical protein
MSLASFQTTPCQPKQTSVRIERAMNAWNLSGLNSVLYQTYLYCCIVKHCSVVIIIFNLRTAAFKAYCANWDRRSNFRHQAFPRVSRENTQWRKVELWARNVRKFCLNADFHVIFRNLLHAVKLQHGTDGFTFPPKEGVLRNFLP